MEVTKAATVAMSPARAVPISELDLAFALRYWVPKVRSRDCTRVVYNCTQTAAVMESNRTPG